jgi:hypothetical protein
MPQLHFGDLLLPFAAEFLPLNDSPLPGLTLSRKIAQAGEYSACRNLNTIRCGGKRRARCRGIVAE